jgi:hypothetical protein
LRRDAYNMTEMNKRGFRCAIYTRVSTDLGLEQDFNSLDAQRDASEAYIKSQSHEGCDRFGISTTTAAIRVGRWTGPHCRGF